MKSPEDVDRSDGATCEFRRHIRSNTREPEHLNIESFASCFCGFELFPGVVPQPKVELLPRHGLLHGVGMSGRSSLLEGNKGKLDRIEEE
jgi:hypothetical protein